MPVWTGWDARLERAREHVDELEAEVARAAGRVRDAMTHEFDPERGLYIYNLGKLDEPPYRLGILAGEVAHTLRGVLNQLAYALSPSETIVFPIFDRAGKRFSDALREFPVHSRTELRRWQPFNAGTGAQDHPLWIIHRLDIVEKHLCIPVPPFSVSVGRPSLTGYTEQNDAILAVPAIAGVPEPELHPDIIYRVSLEPFPSAAKLVPISALGRAHEYVRERVVPAIEELL